jgi:hypothetical protein
MANNFSKRPLLFVLLVALVAAALLGVSCHLTWTDHGHETSSCAVCAWFHFKGWIASALVLLVCFVLQRLLCVPLFGSFSCCLALHSARAPPRR